MKIGEFALAASAFLLALAGLLAAAETCTLATGSTCNLTSVSPDCCTQGLICAIQSGTSGSCCIPSGSALSCSSNSSCCSGKCSGSSCVSDWGSGFSCSSSSDCGSSYPICAVPSAGGQAVCSSCVPVNSTTQCSSILPCCSGGICAPSSTCVSCFAQNVTCTLNSDCCSGRCEATGQSGAKKCVPAVSCGQKGGMCTAGFSCCTSPETLFCDYLNPLPYQPDGTGTCRTCFPAGFACNATYSSCAASYECRTAPSLGSMNYSMSNASLPATAALFNNWLKVGNATFTNTTNAHSGSTALYISGGPSSVNVSYIYNAFISLSSNSNYALEFWAIGSASDTGVRYAIYDAMNDAYLNETGGWNLNSTGNTPVIFSSGITSPTYAKASRVFKTLASNVSHVQIRFYPANSGFVYLDDVEIVQLYDLSMLAWVRASRDQSSTLFYSVDREEGMPKGFNWSFAGSRVLNMSFYGGNATPNNVSAAVNLSNADWHLVALTINRAGNYSAYLDGSLLSTGNFTVGRLNNSGRLFIGANGSTGGNAFNGSMDEVRFYRRALSAQEVAEHYAGTYQDKCTMNISVNYAYSTGSESTYYNAYLRARSMPAETLLSMTFDMNASANTTGAVTDHSRFLISGRQNASSWNPNGIIGGAYNFTGQGPQTQKITLPTPLLTGTGDFTLSAWINPTSPIGGEVIMGNYGTSLNRDGIKLSLTWTGVNPSYLHMSCAGDTINSNTTFSANTWTHVAVRRKAGNATFFVNGAPAGSGTAAGSITGNASFTIANDPDGAYFSGLMDEVRVFSKALSDSEIRALYRDTWLLVNSTVPTAGR